MRYILVGIGSVMGFALMMPWLFMWFVKYAAWVLGMHGD